MLYKVSKFLPEKLHVLEVTFLVLEKKFHKYIYSYHPKKYLRLKIYSNKTL